MAAATTAASVDVASFIENLNTQYEKVGQSDDLWCLPSLARYPLSAGPHALTPSLVHTLCQCARRFTR